MPGMGTRPTTDKVKEAMFNIVGPYFDGGEALDLFAGTGALGIEAISRGMQRAVFIDVEKRSIDTIKHNIRLTKFEEVTEVFRSDATQALRALAKRGRSFDIVFLDPPYRLKEVPQMLQYMGSHGLVIEGGTVVVEHEAQHEYPEIMDQFRLHRRTVYGETALSIYGYTSKQEG